MIVGEAVVVAMMVAVFEAAAVEASTAVTAICPLVVAVMIRISAVVSIAMREEVGELDTLATEEDGEAAVEVVTEAKAVAEVLLPSRSAKTIRSPCRTNAE